MSQPHFIAKSFCLLILCSSVAAQAKAPARPNLVRAVAALESRVRAAGEELERHVERERKSVLKADSDELIPELQALDAVKKAVDRGTAVPDHRRLKVPIRRYRKVIAEVQDECRKVMPRLQRLLKLGQPARDRDDEEAAESAKESASKSKRTPTREPKPDKLAQLQAAWTVGSLWRNLNDSQPRTQIWRVDRFDGATLVLSHRSKQKSGRVEFTLRVASTGRLEVVQARHLKTRFRVTSRDHTGTGLMKKDSMQFSMRAELRVDEVRKRWQPWVKKFRFKRVAAHELLPKGAKVRGRRTESDAAVTATMAGTVERHDSKWMVIRAEERWRRANPTYEWRFQRDGSDAAGRPRWRIRDGKKIRSRSGHTRSNWRGYVVLDGNRLVGRYGFDFTGMKKPGTKELTAPLVLTIESGSILVDAR